MSEVPTGPRSVYDTVARAYDERLSNELDHKPLDRGLLASFAELTAEGTLADVGCGPGHVTRHLTTLHDDVVGVDLAPAMIAIARERDPGGVYAVASMLDLPVRDAAWLGVAALYSIIHLDPDERRAAFTEFARVLRPGGYLLVAFHVESADVPMGGTHRSNEFLGYRVELDGYFLDPDEVTHALRDSGFSIVARMDREPIDGAEFLSRRSYLLARRR